MQDIKLTKSGEEEEEEANNNNNNNNNEHSSFFNRKQETVRTNEGIPRRQAQVVVVGAGLAGLATAQRLHKAGIEDIIILDALDRVGGRVHTISHSDYLLELGAQWLHGADSNPLYHWLRSKDMINDFEDEMAGFNGTFYTERGERVDPNLLQRVLDIVLESKLAMFRNECVDLIENNGFKNASEVFRHLLNLQIESDSKLKEQEDLVNSLFDWFLRYENIENGSSCMKEVSIASYTDYNDLGDGTLLNFKHGYRSLLHWFTDEMPTDRCLHLNKQVINIETLKSSGSTYQDKSGSSYSKPMVVRYSDSNYKECQKDHHETSDASIIECDHVVVTASIGFLKKNHKTLFTPQLPEVKRELIESIGFGTVNKIVLQFEEPFWSGGIKIIWDNKKLEGFPEWARDIISFDVVRRQPNLLIGWIGGHGARLMELESDQQVANICLRILGKFIPKTERKPSKLLACFCSCWSSNPYICGSYSFRSIDSFGLKVENLHEPLYDTTESQLLNTSQSSRVPRVLFAGEATAGQLYSTTHGAIMSGWREADRLLYHLLGSNRNYIKISSSKEMYQMSASPAKTLL